MKVLSIDPGFGRTGFAVIEKNGGKETLVFSECFVTSKNVEFSERLVAVGDQLKKIIQEYSPDHIAIEELFFKNNQKTVMQVSEARGALLYVAASAGVPVHEYTPLQIKVAITGYGASDKDQVAFMVKKLVDLPDKKRLDDELDAIACGLTHLAYCKTF